MTAGLVVALDFSALGDASRLATRVCAAAGMFKVGLELFVAEGPAAVREIARETGRPVFLDLKLHDIPETVERAVARASAMGVRVLTVHGSGGRAMLRRAVDRAAKEGTGLQIAAITVLTSLDDGDLASAGVGGGVMAQAERLAALAWEEGVRAFVCSPREAARLRALLGPEATLITPGVRPGAGAVSDDQKRTMTAAEAVAAGARWLVVGRPIRDAPDPLAAARALAAEIDHAAARAG
jgi:orotidine-5'-phosphate decarboxylase